jgi:outer membrane receptor protein involved in Fe transport
MFSTQVRHHSGYFSDELETRARRVPGATQMDVRAEWSPNTSRLFVYVRNLFDAFNLTYRFSNGFVTATEARQIGIGIDMRF